MAPDARERFDYRRSDQMRFASPRIEAPARTAALLRALIVARRVARSWSPFPE
jgi:hypothetical protein